MSDLTIQAIEDYKRFFTGNEGRHGEFIPNKEKTGEKLEGVNTFKIEPVTFYHYKAHLEGVQGLGIVPIFNSEFVNFCVIDVDAYDIEYVKSKVNLLYEFGLPFCPFRSKSGGLHLYLFFSSPTFAKDTIELMKNYLVILNLPIKTEIYPKQRILKENENNGSYINLPYYGGNNTNRFLITPDMKGVSLESALVTIARKSTTLEKAKDLLKDFPYSDGPPCIQNIYMQKNIDIKGGRNNYLFTMSRYWKSKDESMLEEALEEANSRISDPVEKKELNTIIGSIKKTSATYLCNREPMCSVCRRHVCKTREFGIEHNQISNFSFGRLKKYDDDPPWYEWEIDGEILPFYSASDLRKQENFMDLSIDKLKKLPKKVKESTWNIIVNTALENMEIIQVDKQNSISPASSFYDHLKEFLEDRKCETISQVKIGLSYRNEKKGVYMFKPKNLADFLISVKNFKYYAYAELQKRLRDMGGEQTKIFLNEELGQVRCWTIPIKIIEELDSHNYNNIEIDFINSKIEETDF